MYNQEIDIIREEKKVELKRNKLTLNLLSHFPASEPTQRSRDERVQARLHNEFLEGLPRNTRQTNANEFTTQELRALGVFTEITIDNVNNENIYEAIHNTILNVFLTKPSNRNMGVNIIAEYFMQSSRRDYGEGRLTFHYHSHMSENLLSPQQIANFARDQCQALDVEIDNQSRRSDLVFNGYGQVRVQIAFRRRNRVGSFLPTPKWIELKHAVINIKNEKDDRCLDWCLIAHKHIHDVDIVASKRLNALSHYVKYEHELNIPNAQTYPIDIIRDISKYESINDLKINVFRYDENKR
jgi:hypothetical protein